MEFINVKLSDIGEVVGGATPSTKNPDNYDGNIAWITPKDLAGYNKVYISKGERNITEMGFKSCSTKILPKNSVLFSSRAPIGYVAISENDLCTNQGFKSIIPNNKIDYKFLYYLLKHNKNYIASKGSGSTFKEVSGSVMKGIELSIPKNIHDQKKISKILFDIDKKIELNNEINNNLHELEKNLYKEYFKDLSDDNTKKLGELCNIKYGKGLPTTKIEKEGYPVYGGNGIIGYYHEFMYDNSQVLISCRGAASGNVIVSKPKSFVTNNSLILECDRKYHYYLKQYSLDNYYYEYTTGSAQPQITIDNIKDIVLSIPSDELLESFNKQMENLELKYFSNLEEISKLEQLRDTLLPKLMNGEIDLENIES